MRLTDAYILLTGDVKIIGENVNSRFCFKNTPVSRSVLHLNDAHIETAENLELVMKHYNLIEYSDNSQDTVGSLYQFKRDEQPLNVNNNIIDVTTDNSSSFKYKSSLLTGLNAEVTAAVGTVPAYITLKNAQILVPLKYISSFFRSAEVRFINSKLHLGLSWKKRCLMSNAAENDNTGFQATKTELYVPIVTLTTNDNIKLTELKKKGFKRSVFWNEYKSKI